MKKLLVSLAAMALTAQAHAEYRLGGDQIYAILNCQPAQTHPDLGMDVSVSQGGIAGLTQITVRRYFVGHSTTRKFYVQVSQPRTVGAPVTYTGSGIRLTVNGTTAPMKDGGLYSTLQLQEKDQPASLEVLSCHALYHTM